MMLFCIFVSRLGITDLVNKIEIYTNPYLICKCTTFCFYLKVLSNYVIIFGNIT